MKIKEDAKTIAELIIKTDKYYIGNLLNEVSAILEDEDRLVSGIIEKAALMYGIKSD